MFYARTAYDKSSFLPKKKSKARVRPRHTGAYAGHTREMVVDTEVYEICTNIDILLTVYRIENRSN